MSPSASTIVQLRVDEALKRAFTEAVERERTTSALALKALMEDFVRASLRWEAERRSRLVAEAPDAAATMRDVTAAQGFAGQ